MRECVANRGLESLDFWQDWAENMFGSEIAEDVAEISNSIDGRLPTTVANACLAGSLRADTSSWENVQRRYAFVDMFAKLRSRISSSGYRERFDFWQSFFFYDRELAHLRCTLGNFERLAKEIEKEQTEQVRKTRAQNELLPVFAELVQQFGATSTYLQETVTTNGGLMMVVFMEQCQS